MNSRIFYRTKLIILALAVMLSVVLGIWVMVGYLTNTGDFVRKVKLNGSDSYTSAVFNFYNIAPGQDRYSLLQIEVLENFDGVMRIEYELGQESGLKDDMLVFIAFEGQTLFDGKLVDLLESNEQLAISGNFSQKQYDFITVYTLPLDADNSLQGAKLDIYYTLKFSRV